MAVVTPTTQTTERALIGHASASPAGPAPDGGAGLVAAPEVPLTRFRQVLQLSAREIEFVFRWRRQLGDVFRIRGIIPGLPIVTAHPDHVRSLFTADAAVAPSLTEESVLRPVVGPNSVLTANGPRHLRQRKLLLPPFHGEAIERYAQMIGQITELEIDRWPLHQPFALAPRMQAITLDVIMAGILGVDGPPQKGTPEYGLRQTVKYLSRASASSLAKLGELMNIGHDEPVGLQRRGIELLDRFTYPVIKARRAAPDLEQRSDILSLMMRARTAPDDSDAAADSERELASGCRAGGESEGDPLTDRELRDELLTLILAGFETTANSLAWTWERLVRSPAAYNALRVAVRSDTDAKGHVERAIIEGMRTRPVIPAIGRRVNVPWQLGEYLVPAGAPVVMSILLVHHREDLYPDPFAYRPERWIGHNPGTYEWIPFGGGTRRCLGAALAMAEQRVVLEAMTRRLDLEASDPAPERAQHRLVTMIPARGARVVMRSRSC